MKTKLEYKNNLCIASNINTTYQRICRLGRRIIWKEEDLSGGNG